MICFVPFILVFNSEEKYEYENPGANIIMLVYYKLYQCARFSLRQLLRYVAVCKNNDLFKVAQPVPKEGWLDIKFYFISFLDELYIYTALQRKSHLCIPRKGIARPQSQFPHACVCERNRSTYFPATE
jgi:hypothetical protein